MTEYTIRLSRTERHVLEQIHEDNHTIEELITATGFPRRRLLKYLSWLHQDGFIGLTNPEDGGTGLRVDLTDKGIERCDQPRSWQSLIYD